MLNLTQAEALLFLPFVIPVCLWVIWSDLSRMRIPNKSVMLLAGIFVVLGLLVLPIDAYGWRLAQLGIVLVAGFIANMAGLMGAGDSKFLAAAAPFIAPGDTPVLLFVFAANLLAAYCTHRIAKYTPLRKLAPEWDSWSRGRKFPMGFSLGATLVIYLALGLWLGQ